jgi:hypothetical protein
MYKQNYIILSSEQFVSLCHNSSLPSSIATTCLHLLRLPSSANLFKDHFWTPLNSKLSVFLESPINLYSYVSQWIYHILFSNWKCMKCFLTDATRNCLVGPGRGLSGTVEILKPMLVLEHLCFYCYIVCFCMIFILKIVFQN